MLSYSDFYNQMLLTIRCRDADTSPEALASLCALAAQSVLCAADASSDKQEAALAAEARESLDILDKANITMAPAGATLSERVRCLLGNYHHHRDLSERLHKRLIGVSQERDNATKDREHYLGIAKSLDDTVTQQKARIKELEQTVANLQAQRHGGPIGGWRIKDQSADIERLDSIISYWKTCAENRYTRLGVLEQENKRLRAALQATRDAADAALAVRAADPLT